MNLSQLKKAFEPLSKIGCLEKEVDVFGLSVTLRTLTAKEDSEIQKSLSLLREDEDTTTMEYLDLFRNESLSRAIIKVGDMDLNTPYVETGETLEDGTPVKVKKIEAISEILGGLSRPVVNELFTHLTNLAEESEKAVEALKPTSKNIEEDKKVLEDRLADLNMSENATKVDESVKGLTQKVGQYSQALEEMDKQGSDK